SSLPPLGRATPSVYLTSFDDLSPLLESPLPWDVDGISVYQGTLPGKAVLRWSEAGIRNLEAGTRNLEEADQQCSRRLGKNLKKKVVFQLPLSGCLVCLQYFQELLFWLLQLSEFVKMVTPPEDVVSCFRSYLSHMWRSCKLGRIDGDQGLLD
ncbi:hypothetical protein HID58_055434, partial [Brassica napus]